MHENERVSATGINNTVNYKSNNMVQVNNILNINDSFLNSIILSLNNANHQSAESLLQVFHKLIKNSNVDPEWKFDIKYEGEELFIIEKPITEEAAINLPQKMDVNLVIPEEYKHLKSIEEIFRYGQQKQQTIRMEIKELKRYVGTHLVDHLKSQFDNNYILEVPPVPYPIAEAKLVIGDELDIDNINLQITEVIDENYILISNKNDKDRKLNVEFLINISNGHGERLSINLPEERYGSVESTLLREKAMYLASQNTNIKLFFGKYLIMSGKISSSHYDGNPEDIKLLEIIKEIEDVFAVSISLPEQVNQEDIDILSEIHTIYKSGIIFGKVTSNFEFKFTDPESIKEIIKVDENYECCQVIKTIKNKTYVLFDSLICVGDEISVYPPMMLLNRDMLKKKVELFTEGDIINVVYKVTGENKTVAIYKKFSGTNEEGYINANYFVKVNEVMGSQDTGE